jgi:hypothetical protein
VDYGKVLGRAWEITWRWKVLWIFGFLASLGQGGGGGGSSSYQFSGDEVNLDKWTQGSPGQFWTAFSGVILAVICLLFILFIILWVVSVISRGALIGGVLQVEDEGSTSFRQAWAVGVRKFWTLFGLGVLATIPLILLVLAGIAFMFLGIAGGIGLLDSQEAAGISTIVTFALVCGCLSCCVLVPLLVVLEQIRVYGERGAILEDLGWIEAFKRGWQVFKDNLGPTIILWIIFFGIGIVIFIISLVLMIVMFAPLLIFLGISDFGTASIVSMICAGLVAIVLFAIIRSVVTAFTSATWTLAFRELTGNELSLDVVEETL